MFMCRWGRGRSIAKLLMWWMCRQRCHCHSPSSPLQPVLQHFKQLPRCLFCFNTNLSRRGLLGKTHRLSGWGFQCREGKLKMQTRKTDGISFIKIISRLLGVPWGSVAFQWIWSPWDLHLGIILFLPLSLTQLFSVFKRLVVCAPSGYAS